MLTRRQPVAERGLQRLVVADAAAHLDVDVERADDLGLQLAVLARGRTRRRGRRGAATRPRRPASGARPRPGRRRRARSRRRPGRAGRPALGDVDGGQQLEVVHAAHGVLVSWGTRRRTSVATQLRSSGGAGVAGLLGVELGGPQRAVLDGGDEPVAAVLGPGHQRARGCGRWCAASSRARRRSARSRTARPRCRRTARDARGRPRRCSSPCAAPPGPAAARRCRATRRSPSVSTPCSTPRSNRTCMPTQMPSTGRPPARRRPMMRLAADRAQPGHARGVGPDAGHDAGRRRPAPASKSAVSSTSAPARSTARTAERRLPEP